jgi:hypothetical protein
MAERFNGPYRLVENLDDIYSIPGGTWQEKGQDDQVLALWYKCPCGCNDNLRTTVNGHKNDVGASWRYSVDEKGIVTISPSITLPATCKAHFFITNGMVRWC